ncbi:MAG: YidH family protein [Marinilabilia sp.]
MKNSKDKNLIERSREHLANERTFLAWTRTSIALMGFGFVIVRFGLFLKQMSLMVEMPAAAPEGYSGVVGVIMVGLGTVIAVLAFIRYHRIRKQLNSESYIDNSSLSLILAAILFIGGILLTFYLGSGLGD